MKIVTFFNRVNNLDLQAVANKLMRSKGWTLEQTQLAINRYKLFLYIKYVHPATGLVPTKEIDDVWHTHIHVNLLKYNRDCEYIFGYILNHVDSGEDEQTLQIYGKAFNITKALFENTFGAGVLEHTSFQTAACADIPIDTNPAACADLPIVPNAYRQLSSINYQ